MAATVLEGKKWTFKDGKDPEDPEYRKNLQVPASIKTDLTLVKDKKRVGTILKAAEFREELEEIMESHAKSPEYPGIGTSYLSLQHIVDLFSPAPGKKPNSGGGLTKTKRYNVIPINDLRSGANTFYSRTERLLRCKLASVFRLVDLFGWSGLNTHITARLSREKEHYLINPFGLLFHEVTASSLLKIDSTGSVIDEGSTVLDLMGDSWKLHAYAHAARPDVRVIIHLETPATVAVSVMQTKLMPLCKEAMILGPIAYYDPTEVYVRTAASGLSIPTETMERAVLSEALGLNSKVMFIRSMGLFAMGETIDEAWHYATNAIVACETQLTLSSLGVDNLVLPSEEACQRTFEAWRTADLGGLSRHEAAMAMRVSQAAEQKRRRQQLQQTKSKKAASAEPVLEGLASTPIPWRIGELEFEALMRHLDNAGYRTGHLYRYGTVGMDYDMGSRPTSGQVSPRAQSPAPLSTTKGRRARAQSPGGRSLSSGAASDTEDEIEVPPYNSSVAATMAYFFSDEEDQLGATSGEESDTGRSALRSPASSVLRRQRGPDRPWFNTPNSYSKKQLMVYDDTGRAEMAHCWVSDREQALIGSLREGVIPPVQAHPLTAGAVPLGATGAHGFRGASTLPLSATLSRGTVNKTLLNQMGLSGDKSHNVYAPQGSNPNELKERQKSMKVKYYKDLNSSGPQSRLLDSLTIDEARRLRDETLAKALGPKLAAQMSRGGQSALNESGLVTCASRAIIDKSHRPKAIVYDGLYSHVNPFDKITDEELEMYRHEIELKQKSLSLDRDFGSSAVHEETERRPYSDGEDISPTQLSPTEVSEMDTSAKKKKKKRFRFPFLGRKKDKSEPGPSK